MASTTTIVSGDYSSPSSTAYSIDENDVLIVRPRVLVHSDNASTVVGNGTSEGLALKKVINSGLITSGAGYAVSFYGGGVIENRADGLAEGASGIYFDIGFYRLLNAGTIVGHNYLAGYGVIVWDSGGVINNSGTIHGYAAAIKISALYFDGWTIINSGDIVSKNGSAIQIESQGPGQSYVITNRADGLLEGGFRAIYMTASTGFTLNNAGVVIGMIESDSSSAVRDVIHNSGHIKGAVALGLGNDFYDGVRGRAGALFGEDGNDILRSGREGSTIVGGQGKDTMTGNGGPDRFVFYAVSESTPGTVRDVITDFHRAQHDRINLSWIDANILTVPDEAFVYIGTQGFAGYKLSHPGAVGLVRFVGGVVQITNDGDNAPEMEIGVRGMTSLAPGDFIL